MRLQERHAAFKEWFIPKRKRRVGAVMVVIWVIGMVTNPSVHWSWSYIGGLGMFYFISAWPPELHDKR
ncbi:hypothetical protein POF53_16245 [Mitsuaria sp. RG]|jgi:hypothetical protein|nr:hypothetical protein [Mitsuaria sp. RG]